MPPPPAPPAPGATPNFGASSPNLPPPPPPGLPPPPGYAAYQQAPTPFRTLNRVGGLAKWTMIAVAVTGVVGAISTALLIPAIDKAGGFLDGTVTEDEFNNAYLPNQLLSMLNSIVGLAAGVLTMIWMFRISTNLRSLSRGTTFAPVWAVVGWFLPPFLFILPFLVLRELWKASDPGTAIDDPTWRSQPVTRLLPAWLLLYGLIPAAIQAIVIYTTVSSLFDGGFASTSDATVSAETLDSASAYTLSLGVIAAAAAVVWILFVKRLTARHVELTGET